MSKWDLIITPNKSWIQFRLLEVWEYKDLLKIFIKRDFTTTYKQTLLGPLWLLIQPVITTFIFTIIFNKFASIPTNETPPVLFYMSGIIAWHYFANCLNNTSDTFINNANIFGKVYFPRIVIPLSIIITNIFRFIIQFILFLSFYFYFLYQGNQGIEPSPKTIILIPIMIIIMAFMGMGIGIIISSLTTKYRDLRFLVGFGTQLLMYASPIIYPLALVPDKYRYFIILNPMTGIIEGFRNAFLGGDIFAINMLFYPLFFSVTIFILGLLIFNRVEKNFIDII
tara:strand:- start:288 stop:1133 length:846 start_codon:yes stop_codon:yes gene_type:complete